MKIIAIIPARMASTRFPGKPLVDLLGLPMIEHVRRRVLLSPVIDQVIVATCDQEICDLVEENGGKAVMTSKSHERCTDRISEAARELEAEVIINVQGDEPLVSPEIFAPLLAPLQDEPALLCTNLMTEIHSMQEFNNPNVVKTVIDLKGNALCFSREPIPSISKANMKSFKKYKQLGIMAFRRDFLQCFSKLPPTPLEEIESVDMLRALEHDYTVRMILTPFQMIGVDTPEDLEQASELMKNDKYFGTY